MSENTKPVVLSNEEAATVLVQHFCGLVDYWDNEASATTAKEKMEGVVFSVLAAIDGSSLVIPGFKLIPAPADEDQGNYFGTVWPTEDIAGSLHEIVSREMNKAPSDRAELAAAVKRFEQEIENCKHKD